MPTSFEATFVVPPWNVRTDPVWKFRFWLLVVPMLSVPDEMVNPPPTVIEELRVYVPPLTVSCPPELTVVAALVVTLPPDATVSVPDEFIVIAPTVPTADEIVGWFVALPIETVSPL